MADLNLGKKAAELKSGNEHLLFREKRLGNTLLDFWRWSVSDLLSNATRGRFAEFIVATATRIDISICRDEWSAYDLETPEGIKVEVKSAAFLQSWSQASYSQVSFSIKESQIWDADTNKFSNSRKRHADVYVFCLLNHMDKRTVDPMNLDQWEFYVLPTDLISKKIVGSKSISLSKLRSMVDSVSYDDLANTIKECILQK